MSQEAAKPQRRLLVVIGALAFFAGLILAIVGGIVAKDNSGIILTLAIGGIIVGLLNITAREVVPFLIAAIALVVVGSGGFAPLDKILNGLGGALDEIVSYFATFMIPAAVINALRVAWSLARPG